MLPEVFAFFHYYDFVYALLSFKLCFAVRFSFDCNFRNDISIHINECWTHANFFFLQHILFIVIKIFPCKLHTILIKNEMGGQLMYTFALAFCNIKSNKNWNWWNYKDLYLTYLYILCEVHLRRCCKKCYFMHV